MPPRSAPALPPEARLLLLAARGEEGDAAFAATLEEGPDWERVMALALRDRAHAALWRSVEAAGAGRVPPEVREGLRRLGRVAAFRQGCLEGRLAAALDALAAGGIPVLLLKGAALAVGVYGSFAERPMADLDLLVPADRAAEAQRRLLAAGWRAAYGGDGRHDALYAAHHHRAPLVDASGSGVVVEVHVEPLPPGHPFAFGAAALWEEARPVRVRGHPARVPSPRHLLLHLALHFAWAHALRSGAWRTLRDARALALAARAPAAWEEVTALARAARGASCLFWTLRLARTLVGAPVPDDALRALRPRLPGAALRRLERHFAAELFAGAGCPSPWLARRLWEAAVQPGAAGHGAARPWLRDRDFAGAGVPAADPAEAGRGPAWRDLEGWKRWVEAVWPAGAEGARP